jgi:hypothetical protein
MSSAAPGISHPPIRPTSLGQCPLVRYRSKYTWKRSRRACTWRYTRRQGSNAAARCFLCAASGDA